ncbi:UDP-2,4-diacetamido-2,4,6-trideoxy-beta-L-altropyranose hydrolase [Danxiaibacter flavus]|uniref:UDP-2,4-diacetamido-2,4, 6-trideoxy-beta-L-altropyranose hydrolase n=1 Tax=Danxiaibacter flavus TaxID=3049108 RepID=A0ABV3ZF60_9BACT|nr:UDP-2,4-diacetamido-2,4,6-trideoxy-beta-L-altropyranose hydrolase [Chitinophagaceae bacterium DXS]
MKKVYFRVDGNTEIGLGHIVRSCALANMLRERFECHFFVRDYLEITKNNVVEAGAILHIMDSGITLVEEREAFANSIDSNVIVVLDGYSFNTDYQITIKQRGNKLVCIDDIYSFHFVSDVVINHAGGIDREAYSIEPYTRLYLGLKYAMLRSPFLKSAYGHTMPNERDAFICFGGADPKNDLLIALSRLPEWMTSMTINIVIGGAYRYEEELIGFLANKNWRYKLHKNLNASSMSHLMTKCSIAICSPSSVALEYLAVSDGKLFLIVIADNQRDFYNYLLSEKLGFPFDNLREQVHVDLEFRRSLFDGKQKSRYLEIFNSLK